MAMQAKLWTVSGLSVETGISRRAVAKALTTCPVAGKIRGTNCYWMRDVGPLLYDNELCGIDLREQRARLHKEMADKLEMENVARRAELVPAREVAALWRSLKAETRRRLMVIPGRVATEIARPKCSIDVKKVIDREIRDALATLSEGRNELPNRK